MSSHPVAEPNHPSMRGTSSLAWAGTMRECVCVGTLATRLHKAGWHLRSMPVREHAAAHHLPTRSTGLVGISATCQPSYASDMLEVMCREMETVVR